MCIYIYKSILCVYIYRDDLDTSLEGEIDEIDASSMSPGVSLDESKSRLPYMPSELEIMSPSLHPSQDIAESFILAMPH